MEQIFLKEEQEDNVLKFQLPDISGIQKKLDEAILLKLQKEHQEQSDKEGKRKKKQRAGGEICICQRPNCRIGPMQEIR